MGDTVHKKVIGIIDELKKEGERTTYDKIRKLVYMRMGVDKRTIARFDECCKVLDLMEDEGNGIVRLK